MSGRRFGQEDHRSLVPFRLDVRSPEDEEIRQSLDGNQGVRQIRIFERFVRMGFEQVRDDEVQTSRPVQVDDPLTIVYQTEEIPTDVVEVDLTDETLIRFPVFLDDVPVLVLRCRRLIEDGPEQEFEPFLRGPDILR